MKTPFVLGRLLFGGFFLYNGVNHILNRKTLSQYAGSKKVPVPDVAVTGSGVALILGGASILLGIKPKLGAAVIIGFLAGVSPIMHDFWQAGQFRQKYGVAGRRCCIGCGGRALAGERTIRTTGQDAACAKGFTEIYRGVKPTA
jgi:putative oxidoreductase